MTAWASAFLLLAQVASLGQGDAWIARDLRQAETAIEGWDVATASALASKLIGRAPDAAEAHLLVARVRFLEGRYDETLAALAEVERRAPGQDLAHHAREFRDFVQPMADLARRLVVEESEHFRLYFVDGPDRVLAARGLEVLESCRSTLQADFGFAAPEKVRVEIFPDAGSFEKASTLTRNEIETSGTIALCKFNRLMMLTPRTVLRGFTWSDTLCHEYTHYVLWRRNGPTVPIWLHEGIAKYEEVRWSQADGSRLTPLMQEVLKGALDSGKFVTFEQMHPSFAKLKSPHDVALASAEVLSVLRTILARGGHALLGRMLDALRDGKDWRGMFDVALDEPFESFWQTWRERMAVELQGIKSRPAPERLVELRDPMTVPARPDEDGEEKATGKERAGGRHARLGDILGARGHYRAAALEYEKAYAGEADSPVPLNHLGLTHERAGDLEAALAAFRRAEKIDPEYAPTLTNLGLVHRRRGEAREAAEHLERSARINPFDPRIHQALAEVYGALGRSRERERALAELEALGSGRRR